MSDDEKGTHGNQSSVWLAPDNASSTRITNPERYEPSIYGRQAARDGYARDGYSDQYEERGQGYGGSAARGKGYVKGYKQSAIGYGNQYDERNRSCDDLSEGEYSERREVERYQRDDRYRDDSRGQDRYPGRASRSRKGRSRSGSESGEEGGRRRGNENTEVMRWGATLAGAAIGGFTGHKAKKEGFVGTAVGAIVGGLVAREAEKELYKRKGRSRVESEFYRSKSR